MQRSFWAPAVACGAPRREWGDQIRGPPSSRSTFNHFDQALTGCSRGRSCSTAPPCRQPAAQGAPLCAGGGPHLPLPAAARAAVSPCLPAASTGACTRQCLGRHSPTATASLHLPAGPEPLQQQPLAASRRQLLSALTAAPLLLGPGLAVPAAAAAAEAGPRFLTPAEQAAVDKAFSATLPKIKVRERRIRPCGGSCLDGGAERGPCSLGAAPAAPSLPHHTRPRSLPLARRPCACGWPSMTLGRTRWQMGWGAPTPASSSS